VGEGSQAGSGSVRPRPKRCAARPPTPTRLTSRAAMNAAAACDPWICGAREAAGAGRAVEGSRRRAAAASRCDRADGIAAGRGRGKPGEADARRLVSPLPSQVFPRGAGSACPGRRTFDGEEAVTAGTMPPLAGGCVAAPGAEPVAGLCPLSASGAAARAPWPDAGSACSAEAFSDGVGSAVSSSSPASGTEARGGRKLSGSR
jgi:hypothetical protein